jgi:hypothetical protein
MHYCRKTHPQQGLWPEAAAIQVRGGFEGSFVPARLSVAKIQDIREADANSSKQVGLFQLEEVAVVRLVEAYRGVRIVLYRHAAPAWHSGQSQSRQSKCLIRSLTVQ